MQQALKGSLAISQITLFEPVAVSIFETMGDENMMQIVQGFLSKYRRDVSSRTPYACGQVIDFGGGEGAFDSMPDFIKEGMTSLEKNNIRHWDICMAIQNSLTDLQQLSIPTRLVHGSRSNSVAHAIVAHLSSAMPKNKTYVIEGASHFLVTSHAMECLAVLQDTAVLEH